MEAATTYRTLEILNLLDERMWSVAELAEKLQEPETSIRRYVEALAAQMPVYRTADEPYKYTALTQLAALSSRRWQRITPHDGTPAHPRGKLPYHPQEKPPTHPREKTHTVPHQAPRESPTEPPRSPHHGNPGTPHRQAIERSIKRDGK